MGKEYFGLLLAAKRGPARGRPLPLSATGWPDRNHGLGPKALPSEESWVVLRTQNHSRASTAKYSQGTGESHFLLLKGDDLIQNCPSNLPQAF